MSDQRPRARAQRSHGDGGGAGRLLSHAIVAALLAAGVLVMSPLVGGRAALILHGIFAPLIVGLIAARYFRAPGSRGAFPAALVFTLLLIGAEIAVIDARLHAASILDGLAFWLPMVAVFLTTWATGSLMANQPGRDPA